MCFYQKIFKVQNIQKKFLILILFVKKSCCNNICKTLKSFLKIDRNLHFIELSVSTLYELLTANKVYRSLKGIQSIIKKGLHAFKWMPIVLENVWSAFVVLPSSAFVEKTFSVVKNTWKETVLIYRVISNNKIVLR